MGVLGLTPFLQKHCPQVIRVLPDRLRSLKGSTVVIDGTLITQRLHWAQTPHQYRHVLGWYRLIRELRESDIKTICVFDGKERSAAKRAEVERRRSVRHVESARGVMESERLRRLKKLSGLLPAYQALQPDDRRKASEVLQELAKDIPTTQRTLSASELRLMGLDRLIQEGGEPTFAEDIAISDVLTDDQSRVAEADAPLSEPSDFGHVASTTDNSEADEDVYTPLPPDVTDWYNEEDFWSSDLPGMAVVHQSHDIGDWEFWNAADDHLSAHSYSRPYSIQEISDGLSALFREYRESAQNTPLLRAMADSEAPKAEPAKAEPPPVSDDPAPADVAESRLQQFLTVKEGQVWSSIAATEIRPDKEDTAEALTRLAERSQLLSRMYEKRTSPPTARTYEESRVVLRALGVPCIACDGPYEAEALAASLVRHGCADYVASEDTDVLVYDVPMIRNVTSRNSPLVLISGSDVRQALELTKPSFVDFALLLGTDFSQRIRNIGPARALQLIRAHGAIEPIVEKEARAAYITQAPAVRERYLAQVHEARRVFGTLPPVPGGEELRQEEAETSVLAILLSRFGISKVVADSDWDGQALLAGNYFEDNPREEAVLL